MILGIGTDVVEVARVKQGFERTGERFLSKLFTASEKAYCRACVDPWPRFAARLAAKESVIKALGRAADPLEIEVCHRPDGAPQVVLTGTTAELASTYGTVEIMLSLSHTQSVAIAFAIATC